MTAPIDGPAIPMDTATRGTQAPESNDTIATTATTTETVDIADPPTLPATGAEPAIIVLAVALVVAGIGARMVANR